MSRSTVRRTYASAKVGKLMLRQAAPRFQVALSARMASISCGASLPGCRSSDWSRGAVVTTCPSTRSTYAGAGGRCQRTGRQSNPAELRLEHAFPRRYRLNVALVGHERHELPVVPRDVLADARQHRPRVLAPAPGSVPARPRARSRASPTGASESSSHARAVNLRVSAFGPSLFLHSTVSFRMPHAKLGTDSEFRTPN